MLGMSEEQRTAARKKARRTAIRELGKKKPVDDVIRKITDEGQLEWSEAQEIVKDVEKNRQGAIARQRIPRMLLMILVGLLGGAYLVGTNISVLVNFGVIDGETAVEWAEQMEGLSLAFMIGYGTNILLFGIGCVLLLIGIANVLNLLFSLVRP